MEVQLNKHYDIQENPDMTPESWLRLQSLHDEDMKSEGALGVEPIPKAVIS